jgi:high-affinity iron transporter
MIYQGGRRINLGLFFNITSGMVLIIAAGLLAKGVAWLQASGVLPTFYWPVWNVVDNPVVGHGEFAALMAGLFGWNSRPSIEEVGVWVLYLVLFGYLFYVAGRSKQTSPAEPQATAGQKA